METLTPINRCPWSQSGLDSPPFPFFIVQLSRFQPSLKQSAFTFLFSLVTNSLSTLSPNLFLQVAGKPNHADLRQRQYKASAFHLVPSLNRLPSEAIFQDADPPGSPSSPPCSSPGKPGRIPAEGTLRIGKCEVCGRADDQT